MMDTLKSKLQVATLSVATVATSTAVLTNVLINNNKPEEKSINQDIAIKCTMYDYISDNEIYGGAPGGTYHELNYEVFKAKGYDDLSKTNTLTALPLGSFINDKPSGYDSDMDTLLMESFGDNYTKLNKDIYETYSAVAAFNSGVSLNTATQGLVDETLTNGIITQSYNGKTDYVPWFDDEFLQTKIPGWDLTYGKVYKNLEFPFRYSDTSGYYEFDSKVDTVAYNEYTKSLDYKGMNTEQVNDAWGAGFYPYNTAGDSTYNYGFGVKIEVPFTLDKSRLNNGEQVVFEFKGDDDVWVFIDGYLALDLGGNHTGTKGTLNITEQRSIVENTVNKNLVNARGPFFVPSTTKVYDLFELEELGIKGINSAQQGIINNEVTPFSEELVKSLASKKTHTLTLFYMERAKGTSNLNVKFNLPVVDENLVVETPTEEPIPTPEPVKENKSSIEVLNIEKVASTPYSQYCYYVYQYDNNELKPKKDIEFVANNNLFDTSACILSKSSDVTDESAYISKEYYTILGENSDNVKERPIGNIFAKDKEKYMDQKVSDFVKKYKDKKFYQIDTNKKYTLILHDSYYEDKFKKGDDILWIHGNVFGEQDKVKIRIIKRNVFTMH